MQKMTPANPPRTVLCLGAHCDDIEIGCGGMILKWARSFPETSFRWVVFSSTPERERETRAAAARFFDGTGRVKVDVHRFRESHFPFVGSEIKESFELLRGRIEPDLILTHYGGDLHQDHRTIAELTWNTFRDHFILEYEIPKYDGDLGSPNVFVHLDEQTCREKAAAILSCHQSQEERPWFEEETFLSLMRLRGMESNSPGRYAEGYYGRKIVL